MFTFPAESLCDPAQGQGMSVDWWQSVPLLTSLSKTRLARNDHSNVPYIQDQIPVLILNKKFNEKVHIGRPQGNMTIRKLGFWIDHTVHLSSYIFVCTVNFWEFNIVQSCHVISFMFCQIITWSPTLKPYFGINAFGMILEQDQECWNYMQTNQKNNRRSFESLAFPSDSALTVSENVVGDLDPKSPQAAV